MTQKYQVFIHSFFLSFECDQPQIFVFYSPSFSDFLRYTKFAQFDRDGSDGTALVLFSFKGTLQVKTISKHSTNSWDSFSFPLPSVCTTIAHAHLAEFQKFEASSRHEWLFLNSPFFLLPARWWDLFKTFTTTNVNGVLKWRLKFFNALNWMSLRGANLKQSIRFGRRNKTESSKERSEHQHEFKSKTS